MGQSLPKTPPTEPKLKDQRVKKGDVITFRWRANTEASGTWLKDGRPLENGDKISISELEHVFTLKIKNAREEDEGEYTLELSNSRGTVSNSAKVEILVPQLQVPHLKDKKVKEGEVITFRWRANTEASGTWLKDGRPLKNGDKISISQLEHVFILEITDVRVEDEGEYTFELSNSGGTVSDSAMVEILVPKLEVPKLEDQQVKKGDDIIFQWEANCDVSGTWMKNGEKLENGDKITFTQSGNVFKLIIKDAREEDEGEYTLELWNSGGKVSGSAKAEALEYNRPWRMVSWFSSEVKNYLENFQPSNSEALRFLLVGPIGAGKSSLINSIQYTFHGRMCVKAIAGAGGGDEARSVTKTSKTFQIMDQSGKVFPFLFCDTMGLEMEEDCAVNIDDIVAALNGKLSEGYRFDQPHLLSERKNDKNSSTLNNKVHCLVNVIAADKILIYKPNLPIFQKMQTIREAATNLGIPQVVILTHVDACCPLVKRDLRKAYSSKKVKEAMQKCHLYLGVPMNCIFTVKNYHEEIKVDEKTECLLLDALQHIVNMANDR